jgi:hypothetical protein
MAVRQLAAASAALLAVLLVAAAPTSHAQAGAPSAFLGQLGAGVNASSPVGTELRFLLLCMEASVHHRLQSCIWKLQ